MNLNLASFEDLLTVDGVGRATAQKIVENRPFEGHEDFISRSGIQPKVAERILMGVGIDAFELDEPEVEEPVEQEPAVTFETLLAEIIAAEPEAEVVDNRSPAEKAAASYRHSDDPVADAEEYERVVRAMLEADPASVSNRRLGFLSKKFNLAEDFKGSGIRGTWSIENGELVLLTEATAAEPITEEL